jgi:hypothetical protein
MAIPHPTRIDTTFLFSLFESINLPMKYPTNEIPTNGNNAEYCPATRKTIFATEISNSRREGLAIRYKDRKMGKKRKRNVSDVKSICIPDLVEFYKKEQSASFSSYKAG